MFVLSIITKSRMSSKSTLQITRSLYTRAFPRAEWHYISSYLLHFVVSDAKNSLKMQINLHTSEKICYFDEWGGCVPSRRRGMEPHKYEIYYYCTHESLDAIIFDIDVKTSKAREISHYITDVSITTDFSSFVLHKLALSVRLFSY